MNTPSPDTLSRDGAPLYGERAARPQATLGLVIAWSRTALERVGEVLLLPPGRPGAVVAFGREDAPAGGEQRVEPVRQWPGENRPCGPVRSRYISRRQLALRCFGVDRVEVKRTGRLRLRHNGAFAEAARLAPGDTLEIEDELLLICARRPTRMPALRAPFEGPARFGGPDASGLVGESPAIWRLRARMALAASAGRHVLIRGPSGSGKELVARGLHALSGGGPLVSRNAATLPPGLVDAELFGNVRNYPNPGMAARPGLIGQADGGALLLDEFAEMPEDVQTHFLRVLDEGEYQRLGDATPRRATFRLIAATNRPLDAIREDVLARFPYRLDAPGLEQRREDIPLLIAHLMRQMSDGGPAAGFMDGGAPRLTPRIVDALVRRQYTAHVRELDRRLRAAMMECDGFLDLTPEVARTLSLQPAATRDPPAPTAIPEGPVDPGALAPEVIQAALDRNNGVQEKTWRELGLKSRFVLMRLIKKHGLVVRRRPAG